MALLTLNASKLKYNYEYLKHTFDRTGMNWSVVTKLLCGNRDYIDLIARLGVTQCCDSRISNLAYIKKQFPHMETIFIKPPANRNVQDIVRYADISFNTSLRTIKALSNAAVRLDKTHKVILVVELGELREGITQEELEKLFEQASVLPNIEIIGLGANLTCMSGILPSSENLGVLVNYKKLLEQKFNVTLQVVSGGASVTIPLMEKKQLPEGVNHFRVGETLFFGTDVYHNAAMDNLHQDVFTLEAEIIELKKKPTVPYGDFGYNLTGQKRMPAIEASPSQTYRAIVDFGLLDIDARHVSPKDSCMNIVGASSDMTVLDVGANTKGYQVGDRIRFSLDYMGVLGAMNSKYIDKRIDDSFITSEVINELANAELMLS